MDFDRSFAKQADDLVKMGRDLAREAISGEDLGEREEAVPLFVRALEATIRYSKAREDGQPADDMKKSHLSSLWAAAGEAVRELDPELAERCFRKGFGWADPTAGRRAKARGLKISVPEMEDALSDLMKKESEYEMALRATRLEPIRASKPTQVFISYRREDARYPARDMYDALLRHLPRERVFIDVDSIPSGRDFVAILEQRVAECGIMLALIGANWLQSADPGTGKRRLDNPRDFVRIEIRAALTRDIPVVPVLLDGVQMPAEDQLPKDMRMLVRRHGEPVNFLTFDSDVNRLINKLGLAKKKAGSGRKKKPPVRKVRKSGTVGRSGRTY